MMMMTVVPGQIRAICFSHLGYDWGRCVFFSQFCAKLPHFFWTYEMILFYFLLDQSSDQTERNEKNRTLNAVNIEQHIFFGSNQNVISKENNKLLLFVRIF